MTIPITTICKQNRQILFGELFFTKAKTSNMSYSAIKKTILFVTICFMCHKCDAYDAKNIPEIIQVNIFLSDKHYLFSHNKGGKSN